MTYELVLDNSKMLANCFESECEPGPWNSIDLGDALILFEVPPTATYSGGILNGATGWYPAFVIPEPILQPGAYYDIEITWGGSSYSGSDAHSYMQLSTTTSVTNIGDAEDATWWQLHEAFGPHDTVSVYSIGSGIDEYNDAMSDTPPGRYILVEAPFEDDVVSVRWRTSCAPACTPQIIRPTGTYANTGGGPFGEPTIVGTQPVLADSSDASYVQSADNQFPYTYALETLGSYTPGSPITLHVRMSVTGDGTPVDAHGEIFIATSGGVANSDDEIGGFSDGTAGGFGFAIPTVNGTIIDLSIPLNLTAWVNDSPSNPGGPTTVDDIVAALQAGAYLDFNHLENSNWDTTPTFRVYEAWIEVGCP